MHAQSADRRDFIRYPTNRVVGSIADAARAGAAVEALLRAGFDRKDIDVLHGEQDVHRLDPEGAGHGLLAQFHRALTRNFELEEFKHISHFVEEIRAGHSVIMVLSRRRGQRMAASDILHQHGAEFVGFYGRWACEELPSSAKATPDAIPALFARAWNERNAEAIASLFDEDAEFVNGTGLCCHDRESIRKAHAALAAAVDGSKLAPGETKVKLLSPDIAVVHSHMTVSSDAPPGTVAASAPRTTIVSFVVHRSGERWLCASAHNTDVLQVPPATVVPDPRMMGLGNYPGDQLS